ncbi:MAG: DUF2877 domain-containing protein [Actinomycetota bacterium]
MTGTVAAPPVTRVAAASLALRHAGPDALVEWEPVDGPRFPNGAVADDGPTSGRPVARCNPGHLPGRLSARRWWDPTCPVDAVAPTVARRFVTSLDPIALPARPEDLIGWGPGRTPAGDDVVVGLLIGLRAAGRTDLATELALATATADTAPFSRALLDHAARGEAAGPILQLVRALGGHRPLAPAVAALDGFGATSGRHLLDGIRRAIEPTIGAQP